MTISVFPIAAAASESPSAVTLTALQTTYEITNDFGTGVYSIAISPTSTDAQIVFVNGSSVLVTLVTISGVVSTTLSATATAVYITGKPGGTAGAIVTISKTANAISSNDISNGTLDTINTTGAYNTTGLLSVLAFGGGHAGVKGGTGQAAGGVGGDSGGVALGFVYTNTATTVTIGAKGVAAISNNTNLVAPNQSSFGNLLTSTNTGLFNVAAGGNGGSEFNLGNAGNATNTFPSFKGNDTTGSGGGAGGAGYGLVGSQAGGGSGIGTGGTSAVNAAQNTNLHNPNIPGTAGTGKASGGGGGCSVGGSFTNAAGRFGADGADGVVYVLRGF